jgi:hypothetical protein
VEPLYNHDADDDNDVDEEITNPEVALLSTHTKIQKRSNVDSKIR